MAWKTRLRFNIETKLRRPKPTEIGAKTNLIRSFLCTDKLQ